MEGKLNKKSILQMARGAIEERCDYEVARVIDNILDVNTKATAKRKITITLEMIPGDLRQTIQVNATAKSQIAPTNPIKTSLCVTADGHGELLIAEMVPQVPGQMNFDSQEQEVPKILKFAKA